ncbi:MAG: ADP-ribosylation factor-like protein [Promethearchaeota archaeon]
MNGEIEGLVISVLGDMGTMPLVNMSSLSEEAIIQLSTMGMVLISMGRDPIPYRLYGPIPVPGSLEFEAFGINFYVSATETSDKRIETYGRNSNLWVIFNLKHREILLALHNEIEKALIDIIKHIKLESELSNQEVIKSIFDKIQGIISEKVLSIPQKTKTAPPQRDQIQLIFFYTVNPQGELVPIVSDKKTVLSSYPLLVIVNIILKRIFILKNHEDTPHRLMFFASRAASQLNAERWKNKFHVYDITDPLECERLTKQTEILFKNMDLLVSYNRMGFLDAESPAKIILIGLAESGKTTIVKVVTEGYTPDKKAMYKATVNYKRKNTTFLGKKLTLFDLGGQIAFLDRFTGDLAEFIFTNVQTLIFVIDVANAAELSRIKYYFDLTIKLLNHFSPMTPTYVLFHKVDLISKNKVEETTEMMKNYLITNIQHPLTFFTTSVFSESIFNTFKIIINNLTGTQETIDTILEDFVKRNSGTLEMTQFFTQDGLPLFSSSSFTHGTVRQARETLDNLLHRMINNKKDTTNSALLESEDYVSFVRFFDNGSILFLCFSRMSMIENNENIPSLYEKVSLLSRKLHLSTLSGSESQYLKSKLFLS